MIGENTTMLIRSERNNDFIAIREIHAASFPTSAEARLVDLLRTAGQLNVSLVAEADGIIVGHVAFSRVTIQQGAVGLGLAPLAVLESSRKQGIGAQLVKEGLAACKQAGFGWVVVLGDPNYYGRFGFCPAKDFGLSDEYGGGVAFQAMELLPGTMPVGAGLVKYVPEFSCLDGTGTVLRPSCGKRWHESEPSVHIRSCR
jgi:putative acetyltransferase